MIIRLTPKQVAGCRAHLSPRHLDIFRPKRSSAQRFDVSMPAVAWDALAQVLTARAFHPAGTANSRALKGTRTALHAVRRALSALETHPAFLGHLVEGYDPQLFLAWRLEERWSPYPVDGRAMRLLVPALFEGARLTAGDARHPSWFQDYTGWQDIEPLQMHGVWWREEDHLGWLPEESGDASG